MYRAIYIATSAAAVKDRELEFINRNIANLNTIAYKKERTAFRSFLTPAAGPFNASTRVFVDPGITIKTDFSEGRLINTGNSLDLAIKGKGFFVLEGNQYTRRGDFQLDSEGYLVNHKGLRVLGENSKPIKIPAGKIIISSDGTITVDSRPIGKIKLVEFPDENKLIKVGDSLYVTNIQQQPVKSDSEIVQGALEGSNINIVKEMVMMIDTLREFETFQRTIKAIDEVSSKAINEIGRI